MASFDLPPPGRDLLPAASDDIADSLAHALRYDGRRRVHDADALMAGLVADRLMEHLQRCGFRVMRLTPAALPDTRRHGPSDPDIPDGST